ncbi:hypothetical protein RB595_008651 [Gaeumannomyces hyphopodioides]
MPSSRVRTPTPSPRHRRQMHEVQRPGRVYTYRPPGSSEGLSYLDSGSEIHLTRLWSVPTGQFPDAPPYYREGDPPPLENLATSDDPADWRTGKKVVNIGLVAVFAFITALTSAIFAPAALELKGELGAANQALGELSLSIFVLGSALGALAAAPASESWGRAPVYWLSGAAFAGLTAACGSASSTAELLAYRFLGGLFGSTPLVVGAATVADVVPARGSPPARRAAAMAALTAGPLLGTLAGPVVGGSVADARGWRWAFWALGAASAALALLMVLALRETCPAVLERRRAVRAARVGARPEPLAAAALLARGRPGGGGGGGGNKKKGSRNNEWLLRGYVVFSPVAGALAAYTAVLFGCFYLLLASLPSVFGDAGGGVYDLGERSMQLSYLGVGAGALLGLAYYVYAVKHDARKLGEEREGRRNALPPLSPRAKRPRCAHCRHCLQAAEAGCDDEAALVPRGPAPHPTPEDRLRPLRLSALSVPVGLAIYGWTASAGAHWVLPMLGSAAAGFGVAGVFAAAQLYLVEAFPGFPASAVASNVMLRSLTAGGLPMAGPAMLGTLGVGWCGTVLAVVAFGLVPVPWLVVSPAYDVLWTAAVELDVTIYLHPTFPPEAAMLATVEGLYAPAASPFTGGSSSTISYSSAAAVALGGSAWGIVLGHMGEMAPYFLERAERRLAPHRPAGLATLWGAYARNVHVTVEGYFSLNALPMLLAVTDASRAMHSYDYPFNSVV